MILKACVVLAGLVALGASGAVAQNGSWSAPVDWGIRAIHLTLLPNKKLIAWNRHVAGVEDFACYLIGDYPNYDATPVDLTGQLVPSGGTDPDEIFCSGHTLLADGKLGSYGGHKMQDVVGLEAIWVYDHASGPNGTWSKRTSMTSGEGRWYPTALTMPSNEVLIVEGSKDVDGNGNGVPMTEPLVWGDGFPGSPADVFTKIQTNALDIYYPFVFVNPIDGSVFYAAHGNPASKTNQRYDPLTSAWSSVYAYPSGVTNTEFSYASGLMITKLNSTGVEKAIVLKSGGSTGAPGVDATTRSLFIDLAASSPAWKQGQPMTQKRRNHTLTALPTGQIVAMGGNIRVAPAPGKQDYDMDTQEILDRLKPDYVDALANLETETWAQWDAPPSSERFARGYHSTALLLPDARVVLTSGEPQGGAGRKEAQFFQPPYGGLSWSDVQTKRPTWTGTGNPDTVYLGETFKVKMNFDTGRTVGKVCLISLGSTTHAFNENQQVVFLHHSAVIPADDNQITVTAPPNTKVAREGYYMLFVVDDLGKGVPSEARIVQLLERHRKTFVESHDLPQPPYQYFNATAYSKEMFLSDNVYLGGYMVSSAGPTILELTTYATAPNYGAKNLRVKIEGKANRLLNLEVYLYKWSTSAYELAHTFSNVAANTEQSLEFTTPDQLLPEHPYIKNSTPNAGRIQMKLKWIDPSGGLTPFNVYLDRVEVGRWQ
jgi:hypothetical protein